MNEIAAPPLRENSGIGRFSWIIETVLCAWLARPLLVSRISQIERRKMPSRGLVKSEVRVHVALLIQIWLVAGRLRNIGWNPMYCVLTMVPRLNL